MKIGIGQGILQALIKIIGQLKILENVWMLNDVFG